MKNKEVNNNYIIDGYCKLIKIYEDKLKSLENNKPFSFQRKKLKEHNEIIDNYIDKLMELYTKLGEVCDFDNYFCNITIRNKQS